MASLTLKVKLPKNNQSKTLRFRANMTVAEAMRMIAQHEVSLSCPPKCQCRNKKKSEKKKKKILFFLLF